MFPIRTRRDERTKEEAMPEEPPPRESLRGRASNGIIGYS